MEASRTAVATLVARAVHQTVDADRAYDDPVAVRLFAGIALERAAAARASDPDDFERLRRHVAERTVHAETALSAAVRERGARQYVVLGAGYDTFAYRQPAWAADLAIFEADRPATQAAKREALRFGGIAVPRNVRFVALDLERTPLREGLRTGGVDLERPVFFSWLGVTMYLTAAAVEATLRDVAACAPGSEIAFTFGRASSDSPWAARAAEAGEPWLTTFDDGDLTRLLHGLGFPWVEIDGPNALARLACRPCG